MKPLGSVPIAPQITTEISNSRDDSVHVVNIISGEVGTNVLKRDSNRKLPANSLYLPLAEEFVAHVRRTPGSCFNDIVQILISYNIRRNHNAQQIRLCGVGGSDEKGTECMVLVWQYDFHSALVRYFSTADFLGWSKLASSSCILSDLFSYRIGCSRECSI